MVTAADMSGIVGMRVSAEGDGGVGSTTCRYRPADAGFPYVEIKIDWGNGSAAMLGTNMLGRHEPGIADPLAGLGDEASAIGPAFMIRVGEDFVNLTFLGVDDSLAAAKRIIDIMRPRMGPSAQPKAAAAPGSAVDDNTMDTDEAAARQAVGGLLDRMMASAGRSDASGAPSTNALSSGPADSALADEQPLTPATGPPIRIPLVPGLTLIGAQHEPGRGDYEPIVTIASVTPDLVSTVFSANLPEGTRVVLNRDVRREDLRSAGEYRSWYEEGDPTVFPGATSFSVSAAVYTDLKTKGRADLVRLGSTEDTLTVFAELLGGGGKASPPKHRGTLQRVEPHAVAFPVLLNDETVSLHAIHARGTFDDATIDFHFLDDPDNPLLLRIAGGSTGRIVRISFPTPAAAPIEKKLQDESRVAVHGIYFDFGKATIRPESEPVLREIATALARNPSWKIGIEGHTDNVGSDAPNVELSRRRAEAVKQALIEQHRVPAANLSTAGFGASRPSASNDTLSGRAQNRRVELVRQ
jgi:outer membrane protein OmpA-like peptidoglycan-associated protein